MLELPKTDQVSLGVCILGYGPTSSGKTRSAITLPDPICFINKEPKDPRLVHATIDHKKDITYLEPESFDDMMQFLNEQIMLASKGECKYASFFHDGLTFSGAIYKQTLETDRYNANLLEEGRKHPRPGMIDRFSMEQKDWGTVASMMSRETYLLNKLSKFGKVVVSTAIDAEFPRWNQTVRIAPALLGREFPKLIHGYFDLIGYVIQPFHILEGKIVQPRISFVSPDDGMSNGYMARCNEKLALAEMKGGPPPLDWSKILKVIRG